MKNSNKNQLNLLIQHHYFILLSLVIIAFIGFLSYRYHTFIDITQDNRNSVTNVSATLLKQMNSAVYITAFAPEDEVLHQNIKHFIARFQRTKSDIHLSFINPAIHPKLAQEAKIKAKGGELIIAYQNGSEHLIPPYTEQDVTNVLARLMHKQQKTVMLLQGHGEPSFTSKDGNDYGEFAHQLTKKGFNLSTPNLATEKNPLNKSDLLIIVGPKEDILATELANIKNHIDLGGNLLWLLDDEHLHGLDAIANQIGLEVAQGVVVDKSSIPFGVAPQIVFGVQYGNHVVTEEFRVRTVFTNAKKISAKSSYENGWQVQDLVHVAANGWLETSPFTDKTDANLITFDAKNDSSGPINIALAIERKYGEKGQRIVVVGNTSFLSNQHIDNGGNLELGLNMVQWVAGEDKVITIQPIILKDSQLILTSESNYKSIFVGFQIVLPLILLMIGVVTWWKRRNA